MPITRNVGCRICKDVAYMCIVAGTFVSGMYMSIPCVVDVMVGCFWNICAPMSDLYGHLEWGLCDNFQCGSYICSVIYANNMKITCIVCTMSLVTGLMLVTYIWQICTCVPIYSPRKYAISSIYAKCFCHIFSCSTYAPFDKCFWK